jgi:integrase
MNNLRFYFLVLFLLAFADFTHCGRHTFATTVTLGNGVSIEAVSGMLGHSDIKTTQIYARITNEKIRKDTQCLGAKFSEAENLFSQVNC